jgi:hypothetical protein
MGLLKRYYLEETEKQFAAELKASGYKDEDERIDAELHDKHMKED